MKCTTSCSVICKCNETTNEEVLHKQYDYHSSPINHFIPKNLLPWSRGRFFIGSQCECPNLTSFVEFTKIIISPIHSDEDTPQNHLVVFQRNSSHERCCCCYYPTQPQTARHRSPDIMNNNPHIIFSGSCRITTSSCSYYCPCSVVLSLEIDTTQLLQSRQTYFILSVGRVSLYTYVFINPGWLLLPASRVVSVH